MAKKNTVDLGAHERLGVYSVRNFNTKEGVPGRDIAAVKGHVLLRTSS